MNEIVLCEVDKSAFGRAFDHCKKWSTEHQAEIGVAEMALGVAVLAWGVQTGSIHFGTDVVATTFSEGGLVGAATGAGIGGIGASLLGSIGVAGTVTFGIPAVVLASGGMAILGAAGYGVGDVAQKLLAQHSDFLDMLAGASILAVGIALIIDGAQRVIKDERVLELASKFKDGVIQLAPLTTKIIARTKDELQNIIEELATTPEAGLTAGGTAVAGAAVGSTIAAGSVTVLGSHGLGGVALSLGLVSAPVWPIVAGGAAGLAIGVAAWKGVKHFRNKKALAGQDSGSIPLLSGPNADQTKGE